MLAISCKLSDLEETESQLMMKIISSRCCLEESAKQIVFRSCPIMLSIPSCTRSRVSRVSLSDTLFSNDLSMSKASLAHKNMPSAFFHYCVLGLEPQCGRTWRELPETLFDIFIQSNRVVFFPYLDRLERTLDPKSFNMYVHLLPAKQCNVDGRPRLCAICSRLLATMTPIATQTYYANQAAA
jgi:hypothetical protein